MPQSSSSRTQPPPQTTTSKKPVDKFHDGPVHVSIWHNNGPKGAFRTASLELRYRDKDKQWQTGRSFSSTALLHLECAAREAHARIEKWQQAAKRNAPRS